MEDSFRHYQAGKPEEAYQLAVNAYLEGFELAEAALDNRNHELRTRIEVMNRRLARLFVEETV